MSNSQPSRRSVAAEQAPADAPASRASLFQKLFGGSGGGGGGSTPTEAEAAPVRARSDVVEPPNAFRQALGSVASSWRAVLSAAASDSASSADRAGGAEAPWKRVGSPFVRIALCGESQSGRGSLARHAEGRFRKMSQRAAPFIEKRVPSTQRAGGTSYTYEVVLQSVRRQTYSTLITIADTGPSQVGTAGTSVHELQQADAIVLVFPLTGIKQQQRYVRTSSGTKQKGVVSPDTVLISPQSEALLTRLLSAAAASRYDASVRVYLVATFLDCLSDTSIPAVRAVLACLRARAHQLMPSLVLPDLFAVSLTDESCVAETALPKPDDLLELTDMWTAVFRDMCTTALRQPHDVSLSKGSATVPATVWRPVPYSVVLKQLEAEWCTVDSTASLMAERQPLAYLHSLEAKMNVSSQRALLFIEQSQARQDVVFLSVESLWKRFFALGVTSHAQFVQLMHYLEGRGQVAVFTSRTLHRGHLPSAHAVANQASHRRRPNGAARKSDGGSSQLTDCVCMHPHLLRQAEAAVFWYHRLVTAQDHVLETALYGVDCAACRAADVDHEVPQGFFSPGVLMQLSAHLALPEHFNASARQRLQIFVSLLCFADVACVVRDHQHHPHSPTSAPLPVRKANRLMTEPSTPAASHSTTAGVFCAPDAGGPQIVEVESLMPVFTPRKANAEVDSYVTPFARVASSVARDAHGTVSNEASEASSARSAASQPSVLGGTTRRWRLLVPSLLVPFPCPTHLVQTAASVMTDAVPPDTNLGPTLVRSALYYTLSPPPPPAVFTALTARFAAWCLPPFFTDALWLWPRRPALRGTASVPVSSSSAPQVRFLLAMVSDEARSTANGTATTSGMHLEMYGFADEGGELSLAVAQREAVIEIESVLRQKFPQLQTARDEHTWLTCGDKAREEAARCTCTADLDVLFACSE